MNKRTQAIHAPFVRRDAYGALSMPVYHTVAFEFGDAETMADAFTARIDAPDYSRIENPTVRHFEETVKALTGARSVTAFSSGMAAISNTLLTMAEGGKNFVASKHLFGNTLSLLMTTMRRWGIETRLADLTDGESVRKAVDGNTAAVFFEIYTNPQLEVADPRMLAAVAHAHGAALVADTTMIPFTEFSAKRLGIDIEVVSSTKYISGGATSLGGLVIDHGTAEDFEQRMKNEVMVNLGAYMTPQVAFLQQKGLETLHARYAVQHGNAMQLAERLQALDGIESVNYVGLESHLCHRLSTELYGDTYGAMLTIDLKDRETCFRFLNNLKLLHRATNLFDNRTLAIHPASTIFGLFNDRTLQFIDVKQTTIRLSIGLENTDDLMDDIRQALAAALGQV